MAKNNDPEAARRAQDVVAFVSLSPVCLGSWMDGWMDGWWGEVLMGNGMGDG
jgi:hypothetical protein